MTVKLILLVLTTIPLCSIGQMRDTTQPMPSKTEYQNKSIRNLTPAIVLLGSGLAGLFATAVFDVVESLDYIFAPEPEQNRSYTAAYLISAGVGLASIPFFSAAAKNRRLAKGATTFIKYEQADVANSRGLAVVRYPAVAIKIRL